MVTQIGSVTGRRIYQSALPGVRAQAQVLPYYSQLRQQQSNADRTYELQQDQLDLQQQQAAEQAKQNEQANRAARIGLGMNAGLQLGRMGGDDTPKTTPSAQPQMDSADIGADIAAGGTGQPEPGMWDKAGSAISNPTNWGGVAFGAGAGTEFGDAAFKGMMGKRERRVVGGAITGALTNAITSGGDAYSAGLGLLGGVGGFF